MRVICFSQGKRVPSSRFRLNYLFSSKLTSKFCLDISYPAYGAYPPRQFALRLVWISFEFLFALVRSFRSYSYDVSILQREFISTLNIGVSTLKQPVILDIDDAFWLNRSEASFAALLKHVDIAVCGNSYIQSHVRRYVPMTYVIPTPVDISMYRPAEKFNTSKNEIVLGWSGTSSGFNYLYEIEEDLRVILEKYPHTRICITAEARPKFRTIASDRLTFIQWSEDNEVETIQNFDIGLMPLANNEWALGKCSYKMLLYMACGKPVVVTDIGMNSEVLSLGTCGIGVSPGNSWTNSVAKVVEDVSLRKRMGRSGRKIVEEHFSTQSALVRWEEVLSAVKRKTLNQND